jgi:serine phosphatase RsbU (regulator of sigma subunit)
MSKSVSIRRSLLLNLLMIIALLSSAIMATTFMGSRTAVEKLSGALISQTIDNVESRLQRFFDPVINVLHLARAWGKEGLLKDKDRISLNKHFIPIIQQNPQISSFISASTRGHEIMLLTTGDKWFNREIRLNEWENRTLWHEWTNKDTSPTSFWREIDYDPRKRPWFKGAIDKYREIKSSFTPFSIDEELHWTRPYTFFTSKEPGITASIAYKTSDNNMHVLGFDIQLSDITKFTTNLEVTKNGRVIVLSDDGRVIGLPRDDLYSDESARKNALLKPPEELGTKLAVDATLAYRNRPEGETGPFNFISEGQLWWGETKPFQLTSDRELLIAVVIPESDLLGNLSQVRLWIAIITIAALAIAIIRSFGMANRYSRPIQELVMQSNRISKGDLYEGAPIVSTVKEVKRLAEAHDRMRIGLKSLFKLERDLQLAQQIQKSTFPDNLPVLRGYEIDAWSEPAEETGGDTYDIIGFHNHREGSTTNLFSDHADCALMLLADATGHGIGPALSATQVRSMLRMAVRMKGKLPQIVTNINDQLCADLHAGRFITAWLGELDTNTNTLTTFSAGQAPILYFNSGRNQVATFGADCPPFGVLENLETVNGKIIRMKPGDILAIFSDGIFDANNKDGNKFGEERVKRVIEIHQQESPATIISALREALHEFTGDTMANDDRTAIILKRIN